TSTCWPARWPGQPGTSSAKLRTRDVSSMISRTSAVRQARRGADAASVSGITLFAPGIAIEVVAERFPEARRILGHEIQPAHPFRAFPEIEMRHEQPRRTAMLRRERLAFIVRGDHRLAADHIGDRHVGGVIAVAMQHGERLRRDGKSRG